MKRKAPNRIITKEVVKENTMVISQKPKSVSIRDAVNNPQNQANESPKYLTYSEKLKHPLWQKKRLEIMQRDGFCCQNCFSTEKTLNIHHIIYANHISNPWDYHNSYLITLCEDCHNEISKYDVNELAKFLYRIFLIIVDDRLNFAIKLGESIRQNDIDKIYEEKEHIKLILLKLIRGL
jgi:5-methylcytosine-specific restriction endonuclease McrA